MPSRWFRARPTPSVILMTGIVLVGAVACRHDQVTTGADIQPAAVRGTSSFGVAVTPLRRNHRAHPVAPTALAHRADDSRLAWRSDSLIDSSATSDSAPEKVILDLRLGRLVSRTIVAYRVRTEALIPVTELLQLGEMAYHLSLEGRLEAEVNPGAKRLVIDVNHDTMTLGDQRVRIEPEFRLFRDGLVYVGAERLGNLFGTTMLVDWSDLTVSVLDPAVFPAGRRVQREANRQAFLRRGEAVHVDYSYGAQREGLDGLVLDYSIQSPSQDPFGGSSYTGTLGADLAGGSLELGVASVGPASAAHAQIDGSWTGVWEGNPNIRQVRIGDGVTTGPNVRIMRGLLVSNAPFVRPSLVGLQQFAGQLGPGWSIEAYRGGDLVAVDSANDAGHFAIALPVQYGENPVDFIAYGPIGEVRQFNRTFRALNDLLPAKHFEYGISGGDCRSPRCQATGNLDFRYGLNTRWTAEAGVDRFWRDTLPDLTHPYIAATGSVTNAVGVDLQAVGDGLARGVVRFEPSVNLRLVADYATYATHTVDPILTPPGWLQNWSLTGFLRPLPASGFFFFDGGIARTNTVTGASTRTRLGASIQTAEVRFLPDVETQKDPGTPVHTFAGLDAFLLPRPGLGRALGSVWMRASLKNQLDRGLRLSQYALYASRPVGSGLHVEAGATWTRGGAGPTFSLTLTSYLPWFRSYSTVTKAAGASAFATNYVQGSLLWDRAGGRMAAAPGPSLERSGITGRVFLDENGNGQWDPGEPGVPGAHVLLGIHSATADSSGVFHVWDLVPFEELHVSVDSLSLASPLLVPAFANASLIPSPNRFRTIDIPIVQAGVIEGRVVRGGPGARQGVGGVTLVLTERRSGAVRRFATFTDGDFYLLGVKPGDYQLSVESRDLDALGLAAIPLQFTLAQTAQGVGKSGIELHLTPKP